MDNNEMDVGQWPADCPSNEHLMNKAQGKKKKKAFIDKKKSTTFRLLHRSQQDPLVADNELGQHVFQPVTSSDIDQHQKFGIYYEDDYDYLQHLKSVGEAVDVEEVDRTIIANPKLNLPSVIFETKGVELKVGLLNQAAPTNELLPDIDPDIAAALEGEFADCDEDDLLDDDFVKQLNADDGGAESSYVASDRMSNEAYGKSKVMERFGLIRESKKVGSDDETSSCDEFNAHFANMVDNLMEEDKEERRTRFTNYSMSSAMIKRPDGLQIIDEYFESLYEQYDEEKCGPIEDESKLIAGYIDQNDERFQKLVQDFASAKRKFVPEKPSAEVKELVLKIARETEETSISEDDSDSEQEEDETYAKKRRWDCESILSTYSNHRNHPLEIKNEGVTAKKKRAAKLDLNRLQEEDMETESVCTTATTTIRAKGETPEERRLRKAAVREDRRDRRIERKMNKNAFKDQKKQFDAQRAQVQLKVRPIK